MLSPHVFRAYDIRGIVGKDLDRSGMQRIARGYARFLQHRTQKKNLRIVLGRDGRLSSEELSKAFLDGLLEEGVEVTDTGLSPTPLLFFSTCVGKYDGGVNITASHNPAEYNGCKLQEHDAHALCGDDLQDIRNFSELSSPLPKKKGIIIEKEYRSAYCTTLQGLSSISGRPKIVIDAGNGVAGLFAEELFSLLGCEVIPLYCEIDGRFPNHEPDPEREENLQDLKKMVQHEQAFLGIAFDGDGDRVGIVDAEGVHFSADLLLLLLARDLLSRYPGAKIVADLKATQNLFQDIRARGGTGIMVKTGHSFVEQKMREEGALLGGEVSGHLFFAEHYFGFDDAFLAAAKILSILTNSKKSLSEHFSDLPPVCTTPEIKISCPEEKKFSVVRLLTEYFQEKYGDRALTIDGVRVDFGDGAWGIVRASNTSPNLTLRFEARDKVRLQEIRSEMEGKTLFFLQQSGAIG